MPVTVLCHKWVTGDEAQWFADRGADSWLFGHRHVTRALREQGILHAIVGTLPFGSFDLSGRVARLVRFNGRDVSSRVLYLRRKIRTAARRSANRTMRLAWKRDDLNASPSAAPCVTDDAVFIGTIDDGNAADARVISLDPASGEPRWTRRVRQSVKSPIVCTDGLLIAVSATGAVHCLDPATGAVRWRAELPNHAHRHTNMTPCVSDGRVYVGNAGFFACLDLDDGETLWTLGDPAADDPSVQLMTPVVRRGRLYIPGIHDGLFVIDARTGEVLKRIEAGTRPRLVSRTAPFPHHYLVGSQRGRIHAYSLPSGKSLWEKLLDDGWLPAGPVPFGDNHFLCGTSEGLVCCGLKDGRRRAVARFDTDLGDYYPYKTGRASVLGMPAVRDRDVFVAACDGTLRHLRGVRLAQKDVLRIGEPVIGPVVLAGNALTCATACGSVVRVDLVGWKERKEGLT